MMKEKVRHVLIAEDHTLVRAGIRALVQSIAQLQVVAEAADGETALELINTHQPELVLMDIAMPKVNGLEVTAQISSQLPETRIIILSMYANEEYVLQALQAGAAGYLMKDADINELKFAIESVMTGQTYLSPAVSQHVAAYLRRVNLPAPKTMPSETAEVESEEPEESDLTPRQIEILRLIADGFSTREIADKLYISIKTAEAHRANIMRRLDIYDVAGLVRYALKKGIVEV